MTAVNNKEQVDVIAICTRFVMFEVKSEWWNGYASNVGTTFLIQYKSKVFGITAQHVIDGFSAKEIAITNKQFGDTIAGTKAFYRPSSPTGEAVGSDLLDVVVMEFSDDCDYDFFNKTPYSLEDDTLVTSVTGDRISFNGFLKELSSLDDKDIKATPCRLELNDFGAHSTDPLLREAYGVLDGSQEFNDIEGMSGGPVFNLTQDGLCGMIVRGKLLKDNKCLIYYVEMSDIMQIVAAAEQGISEVSYKKRILKESSP